MSRCAKTALTLSLVAIAATAKAASSGVPLTLSHSGYLLEATDHPLSTTLEMKFRIFDADAGASGNLQWEGACASVVVLNGYYTVVLGSTACAGSTANGLDPTLDTSDLPTTAPRWLEVVVGGITLSPRMAIATVPTAAVASSALDSKMLGGLAREGFWEKTFDVGPAKVGTSTLAELLATIPRLSGDNSFSGTNTFSALQVPAASGGSGTNIDGSGITAASITAGHLSGDGSHLGGLGAALLGDAGSSTVQAALDATIKTVSAADGLTVIPGQGSATVGIAAGGVTNAMLKNSSVTVSAGAGLTGGGAAALGGSTTLSLATDATSLTNVSGGLLSAASNMLGVGTAQPQSTLDVRGGLTLEAGTDATLFTGTGGAELDRYLLLLNSSQSLSASGLKAGGILASDTYAYASPARGTVVVQKSMGIGTGSTAPTAPLDVRGKAYFSGEVDAQCLMRTLRYEAMCMALAAASGSVQVATVSPTSSNATGVTGNAICASYVGNNSVSNWSCLAVPYVYDYGNTWGDDVRTNWGTCAGAYGPGTASPGYIWFDKKACSGVMMACCVHQ